MFGLGFGESLYDYQRDGLAAPALFWLRKKSTKEIRTIAKATYAAFEKWKNEKADKDGMIELEVASYNGLLAPNTPKKKPRKKVPANTLLPNQCAGPNVQNDIDLTFKLIIERYPPFDSVLMKHGMITVTSIVTALSKKEAAPGSLMRANEFLTRQLMEFADIADSLAKENLDRAVKQKRMVAPLNEGRRISAERRRQARIARDAALLEMATDYFRRHPSHKTEDVVYHLRSFKDFKSLSASTIAERIKGAKATALRSLDTSIAK